jgi:hypothetical protein
MILSECEVSWRPWLLKIIIFFRKDVRSLVVKSETVDGEFLYQGGRYHPLCAFLM